MRGTPGHVGGAQGIAAAAPCEETQSLPGAIRAEGEAGGEGRNKADGGLVGKGGRASGCGSVSRLRQDGDESRFGTGGTDGRIES